MGEGTDGRERKRLSRRELIMRAGVGAGGLPLSGAAADRSGPARRGGCETITIGFVSPLTGPAAGFGEPDPYVLGLAKKALANGLTIGGTSYSVKVINKDASRPSQRAPGRERPDPQHDVDLMLTTSTPEIVNPVSDACEAAGVPCISTVVPWEAWYFGRGAKPGKPSPFNFTYHFCFGVQNFFDTYTHLWPQVTTNKMVGVMWPNDADGNAIRGVARAAAREGRLHDRRPGRLHRRHERLLRPDREVQVGGLPDLQHLPDPARLRDLLAAGGTAGADKQIKIAQIAKTGLFASQV